MFLKVGRRTTDVISSHAHGQLDANGFLSSCATQTIVACTRDRLELELMYTIVSCAEVGWRCRSSFRRHDCGRRLRRCGTRRLTLAVYTYVVAHSFAIASLVKKHETSPIRRVALPNRCRCVIRSIPSSPGTPRLDRDNAGAAEAAAIPSASGPTRAGH
jgi:hypothetical protein